jgi:hypothetical protein
MCKKYTLTKLFREHLKKLAETIMDVQVSDTTGDDGSTAARKQKNYSPNLFVISSFMRLNKCSGLYTRQLSISINSI